MSGAASATANHKTHTHRVIQRQRPSRVGRLAYSRPLTVTNESETDAVDVTTDGRPIGALEPGAELQVRFHDDQVLLAQLEGASFYHRFRDKFGRLAN